MTCFISFLLKKFPESRSLSRTPQRLWDAVQFEVLLEDDNSLVCPLGLGFFGVETEAWRKGEEWILWYYPDMKCGQRQDAPRDLGTGRIKFC